MSSLFLGRLHKAGGGEEEVHIFIRYTQIYVYTCIYIRMYTYIRVYIRIYLHFIRIYTYMRTYTYAYIFMLYVYTCTYMAGGAYISFRSYCMRLFLDRNTDGWKLCKESITI